MKENLNIIVCVKQVPSTNKVEIDEKTGVLKRDGGNAKLNPYDLYGIEIAMQIKANTNAKVTALTMGPQQAKNILLESIYMGADEGVLLSDRAFAGADVLATSFTLSEGIKEMDADIVICGKQTTDGDTGQVGAELSVHMGASYAPNVTKIIEINSSSIVVESMFDNYTQIVEVSYPCVISLDNNICTPRLPSIKRKLEIGKEIENKISTYSLADFKDKDSAHYGLDASPTQVERIFTPINDKINYRIDSGDIPAQLCEILSKEKFI